MWKFVKKRKKAGQANMQEHHPNGLNYPYFGPFLLGSLVNYNGEKG